MPLLATATKVAIVAACCFIPLFATSSRCILARLTLQLLLPLPLLAAPQAKCTFDVSVSVNWYRRQNEAKDDTPCAPKLALIKTRERNASSAAGKNARSDGKDAKESSNQQSLATMRSSSVRTHLRIATLSDLLAMAPLQNLVLILLTLWLDQGQPPMAGGCPCPLCQSILLDRQILILTLDITIHTSNPHQVHGISYYIPRERIMLLISLSPGNTRGITTRAKLGGILAQGDTA